MDGQRVRLLDVAQRAGVSRTTASFVLTGRRDMRISSEAEQRVLQAARELDYRPNLLARSLRTNLSQTIGLISDVIVSEPFAGDEVRGCMSTAVRLQHLLFVGESQGDPAVERQLVLDMLDRGVGGFVYGSMYTRRATVSAELRAHPTVLMNCVAKGRPLPAVLPDERAAGRDVVRLLLEAGHTTGIQLIGETPASVVAARERAAGIDEELSRKGLALAGRVDAIWWPEAGRDAVGSLLDAGVRPTALICLNDRLALGAYQALHRRGLDVPGDVSVVSFDDSDLARWMDPGLSGAALPHFELGRRAVERLLDAGPDKPTGNITELVPMPISHRGSVGPPRRRGPGRR